MFLKKISDNDNMRPPWASIDRVIINMAGEWVGLGDIISVTPFLAAISERSRHCRIYLIVTDKRWNPVIEIMPAKPSIINADKDFYKYRNLILFGILKLYRPWLRTVYFHDFMGPRHMASLLGFLAGANFRFGYNRLNDKNEKIPMYDTHKLVADKSKGILPFYFNNGFTTATNLEVKSSVVLKDEGLTAKGRKILASLGIGASQGLLAIHPGSSSGLKAKRWPVESFVKLAELAKDHYNLVPLIIIGPDENDIIQKWPKDLTPHFILNRSISDTMAILSCCRYLISNDSGIFHLSSALGLSAIGLFGPTDSQKHKNWYSRTSYIQSPYNKVCTSCYGTSDYMKCAKIPSPCMESIGVGSVMEKLKELLSKCAA